jgi:predicted ribosomally synthesized peptide with nif11-like leader
MADFRSNVTISLIYIRHNTPKIMTQDKVAQFQTVIQQDPSLKAQLTAAAGDMEAASKIAKERGYDLNPEELQQALTQESNEDLAQAVNPGVAPRQQLT